MNIEMLKDKVTALLKGANFEDANSLDEVIYRISEEVSIYHQELWYQNEELLRIQSELEKSRQYFYAIFQDAPVGYIICNEKMDIQRVNNTLLGQLELDSTDLIRHSLKEIVNTDFQDAFYFFNKAIDKDNNPQTVDLKLNGLSTGIMFTVQGARYVEEGLTFYRFALMKHR